tara:strand:- start:36 stop:698 length:663 start_codon:yes stop_codon:yes gene_type:complete
MKKLFTILCATLLSVGVFAQAETEAGTFLLQMGGDGISFTSQSVSSMDGIGDAEFKDVYDKQSTSSFGINAMAGYFVADGLAIGLALSSKSTTISIEYNSDTGMDDPDDQVTTSLVIAPTVRYYIGESGVWSQVSYGFGSSGTDYGQDDYEPTAISALSFGAGYAISLNDYISLNPSLGYSLITQTDKDAGFDSDGDEADRVTNTGGLTFAFSLNAHLGR